MMLSYTPRGPKFPSIGDLPFPVFTSFWSTLFSFTFVVDLMMFVVVTRSRARGRALSTGMVLGNYAWMIFQIGLLVDLAWAYYKYYFRPRPVDATAAGDGTVDPARDVVQPTHGSTDTIGQSTIGQSSFVQPRFWSFLTRLFRTELTPRKYLLLLAVLLPVNVLFFYREIGMPLFNTTQLAGQRLDELLANWPSEDKMTVLVQGGNLTADTQTWFITAVDGSLDVLPKSRVEVTSKECYQPGSPEFKLLAKFRQEEIPKQAYCESLLGSMMVEWRTEKSNAEWQQDEDLWEELFDFTVRLFGALAGIVADVTLEEAGGGFLEDMTDVFDMYMMTFEDVTQMKEGRPLLAADHTVLWESKSYHSWVSFFLFFAYTTMLGRAIALIGFTPISNGIIKFCRWRGKPVLDEKKFQAKVPAGMSLIFIELPFFMLRGISWFSYSVPISVLAVKNVLGIYRDLHILGLQGCGEVSTKARGDVHSFPTHCPNCPHCVGAGAGRAV